MKEEIKQPENWEKEFEERFCYQDRGLITRMGVQNNISMATAIKSYIHSLLASETKRAREEVVEVFGKLRVVEAPNERSFGNLPKGQIFKAGQMNVLVRIEALKKSLEKEGD